MFGENRPENGESAREKPGGSHLDRLKDRVRAYRNYVEQVEPTEDEGSGKSIEHESGKEPAKTQHLTEI